MDIQGLVNQASSPSLRICSRHPVLRATVGVLGGEGLKSKAGSPARIKGQSYRVVTPLALERASHWTESTPGDAMKAGSKGSALRRHLKVVTGAVTSFCKEGS